MFTNSFFFLFCLVALLKSQMFLFKGCECAYKKCNKVLKKLSNLVFYI